MLLLTLTSGIQEHGSWCCCASAWLHAGTRCQRPGCGRSLALDAREGGADGVAAAAANRRALDVACDCGAAFCFSCLGAPHEPAGCDSVRWLSSYILHLKFKLGYLLRDNGRGSHLAVFFLEEGFAS